jgi:hypothetical protein
MTMAMRDSKKSCRNWSDAAFIVGLTVVMLGLLALSVFVEIATGFNADQAF